MEATLIYAVAAMCVLLALGSLAGRYTYSTGPRNRYLFLQKIAPDHPRRRFIMLAQFTAYLMIAAFAVVFALYREQKLSIPEPVVSAFLIGFTVFVLAGCAFPFVCSAIRPDAKSSRSKKNRDKIAQSPETCLLPRGIQVIYGVTTPKIFDGTQYRVAYETLVQEDEIPFITCELHQSGSYIGDVLFDAIPHAVTPRDLEQTPVLQIHLDC